MPKPSLALRITSGFITLSSLVLILASPAASQSHVEEREKADCAYEQGQWEDGRCYYGGQGAPSDPVGDAFGKAIFDIFKGAVQNELNRSTVPDGINPYSRAATPGLPSFELPANERWVVVASRSDATEAIDLARQFARDFAMVQVFTSQNGWYAITIGNEVTAQAQRNLNSLKSRGAIPDDSVLSRGTGYIDRIWATDQVMRIEARVMGN